MAAMLRDTLAALEQLSDACSRLRNNLPPGAHPTLSLLEASIRMNLNPAEARNMVQGAIPKSFKHPAITT